MTSKSQVVEMTSQVCVVNLAQSCQVDFKDLCSQLLVASGNHFDLSKVNFKVVNLKSNFQVVNLTSIFQVVQLTSRLQVVKMTSS